MSDRWTEDRNRPGHGRDWRTEADWRSQAEARGSRDRRGDDGRRRETRSFEDEGDRHDSGDRTSGGGYDAGGPYGSEGYGYGWRTERFQDEVEDYGRRPAWQDPNYQGVSPAMRKGEYDLEREARRFQAQDYTRGGGSRGDYRRHRSAYAHQEDGDLHARHERGAGDFRRDDFPRRENRDLEARYARDLSRPTSGGTGGYDYEERGYGDGGRSEGGRGGEPRGGDLFQKVSNWFGSAVDEVRRDFRGDRNEPRGDRELQEPRRYAADFAREARWEDPGHRGRGPKGYQRSDDRISDDAHQRLTEDPWTDASNISVSVSGGEVTLSGTVENREAKHRAERVVEEITGVTHVQNNLRVERGGFLTSPTSGYGDSVLEAKMRQAENGGGTSATDDTASTRSTTRRT